MGDTENKLTRTYSLEDHVAALGPVIITEWAPGDAVTVSKDGEDWEKTVGSHGSVVKSRKYNPGGKVVFKIQQGSPVNKLLQDLLETGKTLPFTIKDLGGEAQAKAPDCWFKKVPDLPLGEKSGEIEWELDCGHLTIKHGASNIV